jgi:hypothetical protein
MIFNEINELIKLDPPELPIVITTFNNSTYLKNTVDYFLEREFNIIVLDNDSTYKPMIELLNELSNNDNIYVIKLSENHGPRYFYENKNFYRWLPELFFATDPDLGFNENLKRKDWLHLIEISNDRQLYKVGVGLRLDMEDGTHNLDIFIPSMNTTIRYIEANYYGIPSFSTEDNDMVYNAPIDTTFSLYNKRFDVNSFMSSCVRVTGKYSAWHYGWLLNPPIPQEEQDYYTNACKDLFYSSGEVLKRGQRPSY